MFLLGLLDLVKFMICGFCFGLGVVLLLVFCCFVEILMKFCYVLLLLCLLIVMLLLVVMCGLDVCDMIVLDWVLVLLLIVDGGKVVFVKCVVGIDSKVSIGLYICDLCICDVVLLKLLILVGWNVNFVVLFGDG